MFKQASSKQKMWMVTPATMIVWARNQQPKEVNGTPAGMFVWTRNQKMWMVTPDVAKVRTSNQNVSTFFLHNEELQSNKRATLMTLLSYDG